MISRSGKDFIRRLFEKSSYGEGPPYIEKNNTYRSNAGNIFFALFAAVAMVGAVGYSFNTVLRGPINSMTEVTRRTVAESTVVTSSRLAIVGATTQQTKSGDCDDDAFVEPLPYRDAGAGAKPTGGGWLPADLLPSSVDPWNSEYGYCAWDAGPISVSDADAGCGGATPRRLQGSPDGKHSIIAIISAGRDKTFQTSCVAYNGASPTAPLIVRTPGSDDIILGYTYAEANDLGSGLWTPHKDPLKTANTTTVGGKNLDVAGGGTFSDKVVLTTGGLVLPDQNSTGACDAVNDKQIRRNISTTPPSLEICDFTGGLGWIGISGVAEDGETTTPVGQLVGHWQLNESSGLVAADRMERSDGTLMNGATWAPTGGRLGGAATFVKASDQKIRVPRTGAIESSAITISAWVKLSSGTANTELIMSKEYKDRSTTPIVSYVLGFNAIGNVAFGIGAASGYHYVSQPTATYGSANGWVHVAGTYDPNAAAPQEKLYINGVLVASATQTNPIVYDKTDTGDLYLGGSVASTHALNGQVDDARIYNYALSAAQVTDLYNLGTPALNLQIPRKSGRLMSWGSDTNGALGNGTEGNRVTPGPVSGGNNFVDVVGRPEYACGLRNDGTVWCWGDDTYGQLGNGATAGAQQTMTQVVGLRDAIKIFGGNQNACALRSNGELWCWGDNTSGQLGTGNTTPSTVPVKATSYNDYIDFSTSLLHTCGLRASGEIWCWGRGDQGQLGNGLATNSLTAVKVSNISDFSSVSTAATATCGLTKRGIAYCWGTEASGNFGNGATSAQQNVPAQVQNITDFSKIQLRQDSA